MARVTIEDCSKYVINRFELVIVAAQRGKDLNHGVAPLIDNKKKHKEAIIALREIAAGVLDVGKLKDSIIKEFIVKKDVKNILQGTGKIVEKVEEKEVIQEIESLSNATSVQEQQLYQDEVNIEE